MGTKQNRLKRAVRKTVKWGGTVGTVVLVVVWVASMWLFINWWTPLRLSVSVRDGQLVLLRVPTQAPFETFDQFEVGTSPRNHFRWGFFSKKGTNWWECSIPLWGFVLPTLALTIFAWWRDAAARRAPERACAACGYDRAGLAAGAVCPECGAATGGLSP